MSKMSDSADKMVDSEAQIVHNQAMHSDMKVDEISMRQN